MPSPHVGTGYLKGPEAPMAALLQALEGRLSRLLSPVSASAPPRDGGWGPVVIRPPAIQTAGLRLEESLATARRVQRRPMLDTAQMWFRVSSVPVGRRMEDRLGWLATLAHPTARRTAGATENAIRAWRRWLVTDRPGQGAQWVHTSDIAARVIHQVLAVSGFGPRVDGDLRRQIAGSMAFHLDHLEARLVSPTPGDPRRILQLSGLAVGALAWPMLPRSETRLHASLAALGRDVAAHILPDGGSDFGSPGILAEVILHLLAVRALMRGAGVNLPQAIETALVRALPFLEAHADHGGMLPIGPAQPVRLTPMVHDPCVSFLRRLAEAQDLPFSSASPTALWPVAGLATAPGFHLWTGRFPGHEDPRRTSPLGIGWSPAGIPVLAIPSEPARFVALGRTRPADLALVGDRSDHRILMDAVQVGPLFRVRARHTALRTPHWVHQRTALAGDGRLEVQDLLTEGKAGATLCWALDPAWDVTLKGSTHGVAWQGGRRLEITLEPAFTWTLERGPVRVSSPLVDGDPGDILDAPILVGRGEMVKAVPVTCRFSVQGDGGDRPG